MSCILYQYALAWIIEIYIEYREQYKWPMHEKFRQLAAISRRNKREREEWIEVRKMSIW